MSHSKSNVKRKAKGKGSQSSVPRPNPLFEKWLGELVEETRRNGQKVTYAYSKALRSIRLFPMPLASGQEAMMLDHVGPTVASYLDRRLRQYGDVVDDGVDEENDGETTAVEAVVRSSNRNVPFQAICRQKALLHSSQNGSVDVDDDDRIISADIHSALTFGSESDDVYEENDDEAMRRLTSNNDDNVGKSELLAGNKVFLLLDKRELSRESNRNVVMRVVSQWSIDYREVVLPVGDFGWCICPANVLPDDDFAEQAMMLDTIVERKRYSDLSKSVIDSRYAEQKRRLKQCGLRNALYLIEKDGSMQTQTLSEDGIRKSFVQCSVVDGFKLFHSTSLAQTMDVICRITVSIRDGNTEALKQRMTSISMADLIDSSTKNVDLTIRRAFGQQLLRIKGITKHNVNGILKAYPTPAALLRQMGDIRDLSHSAAVKLLSTKTTLNVPVSKRIYALYSSS